MGETLGLEELKQKQLTRRTRRLVWVESLIIFALLTWVSIEYTNNKYLENWITQNIGPLGFLLNGTLAGLYAGVLIGYAMSVFAGRRSYEEKILETVRKKT